MKFIFSLLCLILFSNLIFSQNSHILTPLENNFILLPQGFTLNNLNASGNSNIENNISNLSSLNPAALNNFNKISFGASYHFETKIKEAWFADIKGERIFTEVPQSAGFVFPFMNFRFGLAMEQNYNWKMDLGKIPVTTFENPDGTGEFFEPIFKYNIKSYSFLTSASIKNIFSNDEISLGLKLSNNHFYYYEKNYLVDADFKDNSLGFGFGSIYKINLEENKFLKFGLSFESPKQFKSSKTFEDKSSNVDPLPGNNDGNLYPSNYSYSIICKTPGNIKFDTDINTIDNLKILFGTNYVLWNSVDKYLENQIEFSGSTVYSFKSKFNFIFRIFLNRKKYERQS